MLVLVVQLVVECVCVVYEWIEVCDDEYCIDLWDVCVCGFGGDWNVVVCGDGCVVCVDYVLVIQFGVKVVCDVQWFDCGYEVECGKVGQQQEMEIFGYWGRGLNLVVVVYCVMC